MRKKLLFKVCSKCRVHPFWVILEAFQYGDVPYGESKARAVFKKFKGEDLPQEVEDFCLDVLTGKTTLRRPNEAELVERVK